MKKEKSLHKFKHQINLSYKSKEIQHQENHALYVERQFKPVMPHILIAALNHLVINFVSSLVNAVAS